MTQGPRRVAFAFPGQGSHRADMAATWTGHPAAAAFSRVALATGLDLPRLADDADACGSSTAIGQPAILATSWAAFDALARVGVRPDVVAGHSLGEVAAAAAAGAITWQDAAGLVGERGRAMGAACAATPGAMAAVVRLDLPTIDRVLADHDDVAVANQNAEGQVVVSGARPEFDLACERLRAAGGRCLPLRVEGAFHSPAMAPAVVAVDAALSRLWVADPAVPLVTGLSGDVVRTADGVRRSLVDGILAPVQWVGVQRRLVALGVEVLVEVGPGGVLAGLARRAHPELTVVTCATPYDLATVVEAVAEPSTASRALIPSGA